MRGKKINEQDRYVGVVGIVGTGNGVGVTHTAYMLAVFFAGVMGCRVAVYAYISFSFPWQAAIIHKKFNHRDIKIYSQTDGDELYDVINQGYDCVIVDFGSEYDKNRSEFLMCTHKIVVGSLVWWNISDYVGFIARTEGEKSRKHWIFLATSPVDEGIRYLKKLGISVQAVPYEPDPLRLDEKGLNWAGQLPLR